MIIMILYLLTLFLLIHFLRFNYWYGINFTSYYKDDIIFQDNPDQGVLVLFKGLINVIKSLKFDGGEVLRIKLYLSTLAALSAVSQQKYLYHVDRGK